MRRNALIIGLLALALAFPGCGDDDDDLEAFTATLSGANEVPARTTAGAGQATFELDGNGTTVTYTLDVENVANITMSHIHSGAAGVNGSIRVFLFSGPTTSVTTRRTLASGSFTATDVTGISFDELLNEMRAGTAYVNVHTSQFPGGEVRGQVTLR